MRKKKFTFIDDEQAWATDPKLNPSKKKFYWLEGWEGKAKGGIYYRAVALKEFMQVVEVKAGKIVGISFDDSNNMEFIVENAEAKIEQ